MSIDSETMQKLREIGKEYSKKVAKYLWHLPEGHEAPYKFKARSYLQAPKRRLPPPIPLGYGVPVVGPLLGSRLGIFLGPAEGNRSWVASAAGDTRRDMTCDLRVDLHKPLGFAWAWGHYCKVKQYANGT